MSGEGHKSRAELVARALRATGSARFRALGGSMWPWVRSGDMLVVAGEAAAQEIFETRSLACGKRYGQGGQCNASPSAS